MGGVGSDPHSARLQQCCFAANHGTLFQAFRSLHPGNGVSPDIKVLQDVPKKLKPRADSGGEASIRGHLKAGGEEQTDSQSYIPPDQRTTRTASHTDTSPCRRAALRIRHSASPNVILARRVTRASQLASFSWMASTLGGVRRSSPAFNYPQFLPPREAELLSFPAQCQLHRSAGGSTGCVVSGPPNAINSSLAPP